MKFLKLLLFSKANLPSRLIRKVFYLFINFFGIFKIEDAQQDELYKKIGLDRKSGLKKLNSIMEERLGYIYQENKNSFSEHLILFSSISINFPFKNILEIGTYNGQTALILSDLFPSSIVTTIDLPSKDPDYYETYGRDKNADQFIKLRDNILANNVKINFLEKNSVLLTNSNERYDLIWIDGAHGYPVVAMDLINSVRLINSNGIIMIDDIYTNKLTSDKFYKSVGGIESLEAMKNANLISKYYLFPKRLMTNQNVPWKKKYVGLIFVN